MLPTKPQRRSAIFLRRAAEGESTRTIVIALVANLDCEHQDFLCLPLPVGLKLRKAPPLTCRPFSSGVPVAGAPGE